LIPKLEILISQQKREVARSGLHRIKMIKLFPESTERRPNHYCKTKYRILSTNYSDVLYVKTYIFTLYCGRKFVTVLCIATWLQPPMGKPVSMLCVTYNICRLYLKLSRLLSYFKVAHSGVCNCTNIYMSRVCLVHTHTCVYGHVSVQ
jgi:hypothetical protein